MPKDNEQQHLGCLESFVEDLGTSIDGTLERVSIRQKWLDSAPNACEGQGLEAYLGDVVVQTIYHDFYHSQTSFRDHYMKKYGKEPHVNSFVKWRWNLGRGVTQEQHQEGLRRLEVYKTLFLNQVMGGPEKNLGFGDAHLRKGYQTTGTIPLHHRPYREGLIPFSCLRYWDARTLSLQSCKSRLTPASPDVRNNFPFA